MTAAVVVHQIVRGFFSHGRIFRKRVAKRKSPVSQLMGNDMFQLLPALIVYKHKARLLPTRHVAGLVRAPFYQENVIMVILQLPVSLYRPTHVGSVRAQQAAFTVVEAPGEG